MIITASSALPSRAFTLTAGLRYHFGNLANACV
jgi:hypothetical protein